MCAKYNLAVTREIKQTSHTVHDAMTGQDIQGLVAALWEFQIEP